MARWNHDEADVACDQWAFQWCCLYQRDPLCAREYLGALRSTLGNRRDLHAASKGATVTRHFPEVFLGNGLVVAVALQYTRYSEREIIYRHYLERRYDLNTGDQFGRLAPRKLMAARLGIHPSEYATRLEVAKAWIFSALSLDTKDLAIARESAVSRAQVA